MVGSRQFFFSLLLSVSLVACTGGGDGLRLPSAQSLKQPETTSIPPTRSDAESKAKAKEREAILDKAENAGRIESGWRPTEKIENLIDKSELVATDGRILNRPAEIDELGFREADLSNDTWSGNIFSQYRGHTAWRYAVDGARGVRTWREAWAFISRESRTLAKVWSGAQRRDAGGLDDLSPAEKYDLLFTDPNEAPTGALAKAEWKRGADRQAEDGDVAKWYGYCHGWAPASFMTPRPERAIEIPSFDGSKQIKFYPDDIKALNTVLWANALPKLRLIGARCDTKNPTRDENGRITDENCLDVNPGVFHMALVNQLGVAKRNLLIDATYDEQIWNQPIVSYKYKYFNPQTKAESQEVADSIISLRDYRRDKFKKYRASDANSVVGVLLEIQYAKGISPTHKETDSHEDDKEQSVKYGYDLELNEAGEIVGGEWYQLKHPDFIWVPVKDARAVSEVEAEKELKGEWAAGQPVPREWREAAARAATQSQPLARIVERLVEESRR